MVKRNATTVHTAKQVASQIAQITDTLTLFTIRTQAGYPVKVVA